MRCPEYSFKLIMNPSQHPEFDKNIHQLIALATSLCNSCGGVIFLTADHLENITRGMVERFESRLTEVLVKQIENLPCHKINFLQVPLRLGVQKPWSAIHLKRCKPVGSRIHTDLHGDIQIEETSNQYDHGKAPKPHVFNQDTLSAEGPGDTREQSEDNQTGGLAADRSSFISNQQEHFEPCQMPDLFSPDALGTEDDPDDTPPSGSAEDDPDNTPPEGDPDDTPPSGDVEVASDRTLSTPESESLTTSLGSDEDTNLPVDYFFLDKLEWSKNKKDWESFVHGETPTIDTIINACSLWQPTTPMTVTPDRTALEHWFESPDGLRETLTAVDTKEPGFAVVCKTWHFHISNNETTSRPPGHICDILTVSKNGTVCLWVICRDHAEQNISCQMAYLLTTGRMIKYRLVHEAGEEDLSNLCIECRLFYPGTSAPRCIGSTIEESLEMQNHVRMFCNDG